MIVKVFLLEKLIPIFADEVNQGRPMEITE